MRQSPFPLTEPSNSCITRRSPHPDDAIVLASLKLEDVQDWCLSRIAEYKASVAVVRAQPDLALYNASLHEFVVRHKSNMWALRSIYNDAAPIHRYLPPELLLEVFANLRHDGTHYGPSALRVCHYWHVLLQRTPQLWQTLLKQQFRAGEDPQWKAKRFAAAVSRSAPLDLSLRLRSINHAVVDILAPHSRRITSMTLQPLRRSHEFEPFYRFLQLDMPMLRCFDIYSWLHYGKTTGISADHFFTFSRLQTLHLVGMHLGPPETPHTLLRHLKLTSCLEFIPSNSSSPARSTTPMSMHTLLAITRNCPNLQTLLVKGRFSRDMPWRDTGLPVNTSKLSHLTLQFHPPAAIPAFLSCLILPLTTVLDLEPVLTFTENQLLLSTSVVTPLGRPPVAELSMHIKASFMTNSTTWETQGDAYSGRPLRVAAYHYHALSHLDATLERTNEVLAIFAPGTAVTSLTITSCRSLRSEEFWTGLLVALPHLTRLAVDPGRAGDYPRILPLLGKPQGNGAYLCPSLTHLSVLWDPQTDFEEWTEQAAEGPEAMPASTSVGADSEWTVAQEYCHVLQRCLRNRAEQGCLPLRAISVSIWNRGYGAEVEAGLREGLKDLAKEVSVGFQSKQGW